MPRKRGSTRDERGRRVLDERRKTLWCGKPDEKIGVAVLLCTAQCKKRRDNLGVETRGLEYPDGDRLWHAGTVR